ncbi:MAG: OmpA family protein [Chthoniobacterales bacterium]
MRLSRADAVKELEELRRLLLSRDREQLRELRTQFTDKERRSHDVAAILPEAIKLSRDRNDELSRALRPSVEGSVKASIQNTPDVFVEALHPIIGPMVRRSIAESLRRLLQSLNQTLEHTFSWRGLKWRFEALRTGKSFAEVVLLRSLVFRVEQLFLIHRETSMSLLHVAADPSITKDSDMVAGMLSAIQDFARDSFDVGGDSALEEFRVGEMQVWIAPGRHAYLAAAIRGTPPRDLRVRLEEAIESIHVLKGSALASFDGDAAQFETVRPELESCLYQQFSATKEKKRPTRAVLTLVVVAALITAALVSLVRAKTKWSRFVRQLNAQPGIVVTDAHRHWFGKSEISGLRDAAAPEPNTIAQQLRIDPSRVRFDWKDYLALDSASVQRRAEHRFETPAGAALSVENGTLNITGSAPYEWLQRVRNEATLVPGVTSLNDRDVNVVYDPRLAQKRFIEQLGLPDGANATVQNSVLVLSGEAPHPWLGKIREEAPHLPGITSVDERNIVDLDLRGFLQSVSVIENAFVYFLVSKDNIATEGFTALSRLPEELRRCESAAKRLGKNITLEIHGYADATGTDGGKNLDLSRRRAERVRDFLANCGFAPEMLQPIGEGVKAPPAPDGRPLPDEAERRVQFKVVPKPQ